QKKKPATARTDTAKATITSIALFARRGAEVAGSWGNSPRAFSNCSRDTWTLFRRGARGVGACEALGTMPDGGIAAWSRLMRTLRWGSTTPLPLAAGQR